MIMIFLPLSIEIFVKRKYDHDLTLFENHAKSVVFGSDIH